MKTLTKPTILPVAPEIEEDVITLTISEVDRQEAGRYTDIENCLICTALKNRGHNVWSVIPNQARLENRDDLYNFDYEMGPEPLFFDRGATTAPFYGPEVVGKVIRLRKVK